MRGRKTWIKIYDDSLRREIEIRVSRRAQI